MVIVNPRASSNFPVFAVCLCIFLERLLKLSRKMRALRLDSAFGHLATVGVYQSGDIARVQKGTCAPIISSTSQRRTS